MSKILTAPIHADDLVGSGRENKYWKQTARFKRMVRLERRKTKHKGYIIFTHCGQRHKRPVAAGEQVKTQKGMALAYTCNVCHCRVPVLQPLIKLLAS